MLGKLMKHELRATSRTMLPLFAVLTVLAIVSGFSMSQLNLNTDIPSFVEFVIVFLFMAFFLAVFATALMAYIMMVSRFYKNLLGDEGYLSMTLPVSIHNHIWAKLLVSCLWFVLSAILIFLLVGLVVMILSLTEADLVRILGYFKSLPPLSEIMAAFFRDTGFTGLSLSTFLLELVLIVILGMLSNCLFFYASMAIGHSFSNHKIRNSVLAFVGISFLFELMSFFYKLLLYVTNMTDAILMASSFVSTLLGMMGIALVILLAQTVFLYILTVFFLKKRLNLA